MNHPQIKQQVIDALLRNPEKPVTGEIKGCRFAAHIGIPNYSEKVLAHYPEAASLGLSEICRRTEVPYFHFQHFGLFCVFESPAKLHLYDEERTLEEDVREMVHSFGPVIFQNAYLDAVGGKEDQRNIFSHLNFHFDRGSNQPTQYSLFSRSPTDPVQSAPRKSSTLYISNVVAHLQFCREHGLSPEKEPGRPRYDIFHNEKMKKMIGQVALEHAWDAPKNTGEVAIIHNRPLLHASYYRKKGVRGYPIGVRYLK